MNRRNTEALTIAQRLHTVYPEKPATLYALSLAPLATGNAKAAVTGLRSVVEPAPGAPPEAWYLLATAQLAAGDQDAARATLDKVLGLQNDYLPALITKAQLLARNQQYDQALKEIKTIQSRYADQSIGYRLEGDLYRQQGDFPKASRAYQAAYERAADSNLVLALAGTQHQQGKQEEVIATLRRWLAAHPKDITVRTELADYLVRRQRLPEAMTEYEAIIEQNPDNAMILNNLAVLYQKKGDNRALHMPRER